MINIPDTYLQAKARADILDQEYSRCSAILKAFPRLDNGLTPDAVKATDDWKLARLNCDKSFQHLRAYNALYCKRYAKEIGANRKYK